MNRYILIALIVIVLFGGGFYLYTQSQQNTAQHNSSKAEHPTETNGKPVAQSQRSYELEVTSSIDNIKPNQPITFSYNVKNDKGEILKDYEITHEKIMHFILVRKDLQYFQHLHPDFQEGTGEFEVNITFPADGTYRLFPDFTPSTENPQKLPVTLTQDINVGDLSKYQAQPVTADNQTTKMVNSYKVTHVLPNDLTKQKELTYSLIVERNNQPVMNLEKYLGALGHSVILKEGTLDFIHTHAGEVGKEGEHGSSTSMGPQIDFTTTFPESGTYKIFTQFQHQNKVNTVDYTIRVN